MKSISCNQHAGLITLQQVYMMYGTSSDEICMATLNDVKIINNQPVIKEGHVISSRSMKKMAKSLMNIKDEVLQFIPSNLLAMDEETTIWWAPPTKQRMFFKTKIKGLINRSGEIMQPGLVFALKKRIWKVYAVAGDQRPQLDTELLVSPYFNVSDNHTICEGSTELPKGRNVDEWTKAYFASAFVHTSYYHKSSELKLKGDRAQLWRNLLGGEHQDRFPVELLPSAKTTLDKLIKDLRHV